MKISKEVRIGIVTTIAIGCFIYGFNFLKGKNLFSSQRKFYAVYHNIDGLVEANPLLINGFRVGMVGDIKLANDTTGMVIVTLVVVSARAVVSSVPDAEAVAGDAPTTSAVHRKVVVPDAGAGGAAALGITAVDTA